MSRDRRGGNPWSDMPLDEAQREMARNGAGYAGWWSTNRAWGLGIIAASGTIGMIAYYAKKDGEDHIPPSVEDMCESDDFDFMNLGRSIGGYCDGAIDGKSEIVFSAQAPKFISEEMVAVPEGVLVAGAGLTVAALAFTLWLVSRSSPRSAPAY